MKKVVITSYARTAVGAFLGALKEVPVESLAAAAITEAMKRSGIEAEQVDEVILGHVISSTDAPQVARDAALLCGMVNTPGFTVNRICGSGLQAVASAWQEIVTGAADIVVAGGAEALSRAPFYLPLSARYQGLRNGSQQLKCANEQSHFNAAPNELYPPVWMGNTAENVAVRYGLSRADQDRFAFDSQMKAKAAQERGRLAQEIVGYEIKTRKGSIVIDTDEHPKGDVTLEGLAKLKPAFQKDGNVTAGNATGMNDGAAALVMMSEDKCRELGLKPIAYVVDWAIAALDPMVMGLGPAYAIPKVLKKAGLAMDQVDLFEINEAFAAQVLGCMKEMGWDMNSPLYQRLNVNGGAIALGHPLGCSGARITGTLALELQQRQARYGVSSACIGGGMGIAVLLERA
ncbi:thiolase family protein [Thauera sp. 2A1]|uniref:thiolase family protein n=1 Tax=Thauera sp. 2A1 TaxID=2570191 RepID=UPI00129095DB|nr:thiolase family protein [Thauera sp. 2A1]KAI5915405.1 thiolase family protein [Thauera sp. 2A1]